MKIIYRFGHFLGAHLDQGSHTGWQAFHIKLVTLRASLHIWCSVSLRTGIAWGFPGRSTARARSNAHLQVQDYIFGHLG